MALNWTEQYIILIILWAYCFELAQIKRLSLCSSSFFMPFLFFACSCYGDDTVSWQAECYLLSCRWQESTSTPEGQNCRDVGTQGVQRIGVLEIGAVFPLEAEEWYRLGQVGELPRTGELRYWIIGLKLGGKKGWREHGVTVLVGRGDMGRTRRGRAPSPGRCGHARQDSRTCRWQFSGAGVHPVLLLKPLCWNDSTGNSRWTRLKSSAKKQ